MNVESQLKVIFKLFHIIAVYEMKNNSDKMVPFLFRWGYADASAI